MAEHTKIEWCDHTFNPWIGCTKVSPACDNCYAERLMDQRMGRAQWGAGNDRVRTSEVNWREPLKWQRRAERDETRPFVFCASLADVFDNEVSDEWRRDLFQLIEATPNLVWLLLTKRIGNVRRMTDVERGNLPLPSNVAIGATMATQEEYDRDAIKLEQVKQLADPLFTFGSFEPLLGPIRLDSHVPDWVIVGGESGPNARPMNLDWARRVKRDCERFFPTPIFNFKQVGGSGSDKGGHLLDGRAYLDRPTVQSNIDDMKGAE